MDMSGAPGTPFCDIMLNSVDEAIKNRQLGPIWQGLRMDHPDLKGAVLNRLALHDSADGFLGKLAHTKEEFAAEAQFRAELTQLLAQMSALDPVIKEHLASLVPTPQNGKLLVGSGPDGKQLENYLCANVHMEKKQFCLNQGTRGFCAICGLVGYCSKECQIKHWPKHKTSCKNSQFRDAVWKPDLEDDVDQETEMCESSVKMWGTTPALDVIHFPGNESKDDGVWQEQMRIVFPASGDFASLVETLASVPVSHDRGIEILINDKEPMVVARNLIMTSLLLLKGEEAIDAVINLWYSATMTGDQHLDMLYYFDQQLKPLAAKKRATLSSGKSSIELNGVGAAIQLIKGLFKNDLDLPEAMDLRIEVMFDLERKPCIDRQLSALKEFHRESMDRFRKFGLVFPYESVIAHINQFNKFLFSPGVGWLLSDMADPKEGWDMVRVMEFGDKKKLPKNDLYGRLFFYVRDRLSKMVATMERIPVKIRFFQKNAGCLASKFSNEKLTFDRVDASNLDIAAALSDWAPLLNKSNPHSALITLSHNWNDGASASETSDEEITKAARDFDGIRKRLQKCGINLLQVAMPGDKNMDYVTELGQNPVTILGDKNDANKRLQLMGFDPSCLESSERVNTFEEYFEKVVKKKPQGVRRRMKHSILPYHIMFPLDAPVDATLDCLEKEKQYCVFNWCKHQVNRYVEWGF